jgi:hypothetical protein
MANTVTITYSVAGFSGSNVAAVSVSIPTGIDPTMHVRNLYLSGGAWIPGPSGNQLFVPASQFISITNP